VKHELALSYIPANTLDCQTDQRTRATTTRSTTRGSTMTKEALTLALEALEASARNWPSDSIIEAITAIKEALSTKCVAQPEKTVCPFCSSEWVTAEQHDRKMDRMEQERCVGCEACIDTACGRDECPKGWPKAVQPEQEPVAIVDSTISGHIDWLCTFFPKQGTKLYTTPPQRKPLTDEEIGAILEGVNAYGTRLYTFARAIEAAHGIKDYT